MYITVTGADKLWHYHFARFKNRRTKAKNPIFQIAFLVIM